MSPPYPLAGGWVGLALVALAGMVAAAINAVAGGGSLISFPVLVGLGIPPLPANATNSVGIWPGSLGSAFGFHNVLAATRHHLSALLLPTILGSAFGAWLLVNTAEVVFKFLVPILIFFATMLLAFQPVLRRRAQARSGHAPVWVGCLLQFAVSIYGGYFGAGMGIMMLAAFALFMEGNIHELNAVKAWLGLAINFVASVVLLVQGLVQIGPGVALAIGALIGGFGAARFSQRVDPEKLRVAIVIVGFAMVGVFAYRSFA